MSSAYLDDIFFTAPSFTGVHSSSGCMHGKHFFVPATGAPAGDYELYLLGLDWLPEAIQHCRAATGHRPVRHAHPAGDYTGSWPRPRPAPRRRRTQPARALSHAAALAARSGGRLHGVLRASRRRAVRNDVTAAWRRGGGERAAAAAWLASVLARGGRRVHLGLERALASRTRPRFDRLRRSHLRADGLDRLDGVHALEHLAEDDVAPSPRRLDGADEELRAVRAASRRSPSRGCLDAALCATAARFSSAPTPRGRSRALRRVRLRAAAGEAERPVACFRPQGGASGRRGCNFSP